MFKNIIIVDDNETAIFLNTDVVKDFSPNSKILSFSSTDNFLEYVSDNINELNEPSLLLLDINMPVHFGYEVLEILEEEYDDDGALDQLTVVMVTSSNLKSDIERSTRFTNIVGYIEKPLSLEKLQNTIK